MCVGKAMQTGMYSKPAKITTTTVSSPKEDQATDKTKKARVKTKSTGKLYNPALGTSDLNKSNAGLQIPTRNQ